MRVFVTGATGVLGRRAVPALVAAGHDVTAVVRSNAKAQQVEAAGGAPARVDLFNSREVTAAVQGHDAVVHLATSIPTGASAASKRAWRTNDRLRAEAAPLLARAAIDAGASHYVGESITFPYEDNGNDWIDEAHPRAYFYGNQTSTDAEAAAASVSAAGGTGVILRFAMFFASDSSHTAMFKAIARRGLSPLLGDPGGYTSLVHIDDAASAVVAALNVPAGIYNVAEPDPQTRQGQAAALARSVGKKRLSSQPRILQRLGGKGAESLSRSQRISSAALQQASDWVPKRSVVDDWNTVN